MVKKLFWQDPYRTTCEAKVERVEGNTVELDQTIFYAFSGGQASDKGTIGDITVLEAKKEGSRIIYTLEQAPTFVAGDTVQVKIDGERRKKMMRLHTAVHLVYFVFKDKTGIDKMIGSNLDDNKGRVDYESPESIASLLPELEKAVNEIIQQDPHIDRYPDEQDPEKWHWKCGSWECPCGGTHVKSLKEVGKVALKRKNIGGGKERIEIYLVE